MTQSEDGGVYQCIAENGVGKDAKTVNVIVHGKLRSILIKN